MPEPAIQPLHFAYVISGAALFVVVHLLMRHQWESRIRRWCAGHGYQLLSWQRARFYEGPKRFQSRDTFRIEVEDRDGLLRDGFLTFARSRGFSGRPVEVEWE